MSSRGMGSGCALPQLPAPSRIRAAAVPADVREPAQLAVGALDHRDRLAGDAHADVVARLLELRDVPDEQPLAAPDRASLRPVELGRAIDPGREGAERLGAHAALPFATLAGPSSRAAVATRSRCRSRAVRRPSSTSRPHSLTQAASLRAAGHGSTSAGIEPSVDALGDQVVDLLEPAPVRGLDERAGAVVVGRVLPHLVPDRPVGADRGVVAGPRGEQLLDPSAAGADRLELGIGHRIGQVVGVRERLLDHVGPAGK